MPPKLEHASWIAGIVSAVLALAALAWSVWTYAPSQPEQPAQDPAFLKNLQANAERQKRFMAAWEATNYAQGNVTRQLNPAQSKVYAAAYQKFREAMHLAEVGGRDEEALRLYRESREAFESLR